MDVFKFNVCCWEYFRLRHCNIFVKRFQLGTNETTVCVQTGLTAMHTAAQFGQQEFVRLMLVKVPATIPTEPPLADTNNPLLSVNAEVGHPTSIIIGLQLFFQINYS